MAEIEIVYREYYCDAPPELTGDNFRTQCYTECAGDLGCPWFDIGKTKPNVIPFGDCVHAEVRYKYKGVNVKKYDIEPSRVDPYNLFFNCMEVTIGGEVYDCDKVTLNGKCIYNKFDEDDESEQEM